MRQRCWLCLICLIACVICGQVVSGQVASPEVVFFNHEERQEHEGKHVDEGSKRIPLLSFAPADDFHAGRFWVATGVTTSLYAGTVIALNEAWYKQYPRSSFHFFDDSKEWRQMDKMGHLYTSYFESLWAYEVARWTGMSENSSIWTGAALGLVFQGTVEVLDGFSREWGFSVTDAGFNLLGSGAFLAQQRLWGEQRIHLKVSSTPVTYPETFLISTDGESMSSLRKRTDDFFGRGYAERFLKDYNAQTTWLSVNVYSFLNKESRFPKWLNIAVGYGAENMYGGFRNAWEEDGAVFELSKDAYPRYSQFYLSPDVDFSRIPSRSPFVRTLLGMLNVFKVPGPVLEMSGEKGVRVELRW